MWKKEGRIAHVSSRTFQMMQAVFKTWKRSFGGSHDSNASRCLFFKYRLLSLYLPNDNEHPTFKWLCGGDRTLPLCSIDLTKTRHSNLALRALSANHWIVEWDRPSGTATLCVLCITLWVWDPCYRLVNIQGWLSNPFSPASVLISIWVLLICSRPGTCVLESRAPEHDPHRACATVNVLV